MDHSFPNHHHKMFIAYLPYPQNVHSLLAMRSKWSYLTSHHAIYLTEHPNFIAFRTLPKLDAHIIDFIGDSFVNLLEQALDNIVLDVLKHLNMDHAFTPK